MYQQLKTQFLEEIVPFLKENGFFMEKVTTQRGRSFLKISETNTNSIRMDMRELGDLYIDIEAGINNKETDQLRNKIKESIDLGRDSCTLSAFPRALIPPTHNLFRATPYCISAPSSPFNYPFSQTLLEVKQLFVEFIFPFFDRYQTVADLDQWFNQPLLNGTYDYDRSPTWNDSVQGLIVAKLNHNPNYEKLYQLWLKNLHPDDKVGLDRVKAVKIYLDGLNL